MKGVKPMKRYIAIPLLALIALQAQAQEPYQHKSRAKAIWAFSVAALAAGASMDISSSYGQIERNPALQSRDGRFGARGAGIRLGIVGGGSLAQWLIARKHPEAYIPLAGINIGVGALLGGVAVRNWEITKNPVQ